MSLQNNNEMKKRNYLQNDSSISLEWWLQQKIGIVLIVSMIPVFNWNNHNKKIFESLNLLEPLVPKLATTLMLWYLGICTCRVCLVLTLMVWQKIATTVFRIPFSCKENWKKILLFKKAFIYCLKNNLFLHTTACIVWTNW